MTWRRCEVNGSERSVNWRLKFFFFYCHFYRRKISILVIDRNNFEGPFFLAELWKICNAKTVNVMQHVGCSAPYPFNERAQYSVQTIVFYNVGLRVNLK